MKALNDSYELVTSKNVKGIFENEKVIYRGSLLEIDKLTCSYQSQKALIIATRKKDNTLNNCISIRHFSENDKKFFYLPCLINQLEMIDTIGNTYKEKTKINTKYITTDFIDQKDSFFQSKKNELYQFLNDQKEEFYNEVLSKKITGNLKHLASKYLNSKNTYMVAEEDYHDFLKIQTSLNKEFSKYLVFRSYLISLEKFKTAKESFSYLKTSSGQVAINKSFSPLKQYKINKTPSIPQPSYQIISDDDEKEEFLSLEEIEQSVGEENCMKGYKTNGKK